MTAVNNNIAILGISPRNSYFTKANIGFALDRLLQEETNVLVFIPDVPDIHNWLAYGYEERKARKKADAVGRSFRKTVHEICADRRYSCANSGNAPVQVRIIDWQSEIEDNPLYKDSLAEIETLYQVSNAFRYDVRKASLHSIQSKIKNDPVLQDYFNETGIEKGISHAVHYVISEIAFLNVAPVLFACEHADYVYHREWPIYENFISGKYEGTYRPQLRFKIVSNPLTA